MDQDPLFALMQRMVAEGTWDSAGAFTIEAGRAAARLGKDFALAYPGQSNLKFVQAAAALGVARLQFRSKPNLLTVEFFDPSVSEFLEYFKFALRRVGEISQATPFLDLFQGIWGSLAEKARRVEAVLPWEGETHGFEFTCDGVSTIPASPPPRGRDGPALTLRIYRAPTDVAAERALLLGRCDFAPLQILWNGRGLPRDSWPRMLPASTSDWYKKWAPAGFRLGESYLRTGSAKPGSNIWLPGLKERRPFAWGEGQQSPGHKRWRPGSRNVLYHSGVGDGKFSGVIAQTLESEAQTPVVFVSKGVVVNSPVVVSVPSGGLAVLECSNLGLRSDIFGLKLVVDRNLNSVPGIVKQRLNELQQRIRPHVFHFPARRGLRDAPLGVGVAAILLSPLLPTAGMTFLLGASQIGFWTAGRFIENKMLRRQGFLELLSQQLPGCVPDRRLGPTSARDSRRYKLK